jgi:ATP/maltotriose-dependent transcriptional regulator MalT
MIATLAFMGPRWERTFGDLRRAEDELREALSLFEREGASAGSLVTSIILASTLLDRGDVDGAEEALRIAPAREVHVGSLGLHAARARLHVERRRWDMAVAELELQFERDRMQRFEFTNREFARGTQVRALLGLGRGADARAVAEEAVALHASRGVPGAEAEARLALSWTLSDDQALEQLRRAETLAAASPRRLVYAQVLAELGGALRRSGHRMEARDPLRSALDLARRCGAAGLEQRLLDELLMAGAKPQRRALDGVDSLTAAERRVAELAAQGLTNREIGEALFVTTKTVEVHLGRAYGKLSIKGRSQLPAALGRG